MSAAFLTRIGRAAPMAVLLALSVAQSGCSTVRFDEPVTLDRPISDRSWDPARAMAAVNEREQRHRTYISEGVPVEYLNRTNPWPATSAEIQAGGRLYVTHCASCHDRSGTGYGEAGRDLILPPAIINRMIDDPHAVDQYMLWAISEGGLRSGSQMPAFKSRLTDREIWQVVNYMRSGFPPFEGERG